MTGIRYRGDGVRRVFRIPFAYGSPENVGVTLQESGEGEERQLRYQEDYRIIDGCVVCEVGRDESIFIWLSGLVERAEALQAERVEAALRAGMNEERSAWHAQAAASLAEEAAEAARDACEKALREIGSRAEEATGQAEKSLEEQSQQAVATMKAACEKAIADVWAVAREAIARAANPGISGVSAFEEILGYGQGFFVVNPNLVAPTAFSGIWPVKELEAIAWDGFFVVIQDCPGHLTGGWQPVPDLPSVPEVPGDDGEHDLYFDGIRWWLSCGHHGKHIQEDVLKKEVKISSRGE